MSEVVLQSQDEGVLTITLNRPEALNSFTKALLKAAEGALKEAARDKTVRAVIITGAGRAFAAGQDLKEIEGQEISFKEHLENFNPVIERIAEMPKPVIAAVNGVAAGAGFSLALACDMRVASANASFTTAFSRIGLVPDSGMSFTLPRLVGVAKSFELLAFSPKVSAEEALSLGIVNKVTPAEMLLEETRALAKMLAQGPTTAYGLIKKALVKSATATLSESLAYEAMLQEIAGNSDDYKEGTKAFLEKRPPVFKG